MKKWCLSFYSWRTEEAGIIETYALIRVAQALRGAGQSQLLCSRNTELKLPKKWAQTLWMPNSGTANLLPDQRQKQNI